MGLFRRTADQEFTRADLELVIDRYLDDLINHPKIFWPVLDSCSADDIAVWAGKHGYSVNRFHPGAHTTLPGQGGHAYSCLCGWQGSEKCPRAPRSGWNVPNRPQT
jgi:hypothetical protein